MSLRDVEFEPSFVCPLCRIIASMISVGQRSMMEQRQTLPPAIEAFLMLGGLAYFASELGQDAEHVNLVMNEASKAGLSPRDNAAKLLPLFMDAGAYSLNHGAALISKYHAMLQPLRAAVNDLPRRWERPGVAMHEVVYHPT